MTESDYRWVIDEHGETAVETMHGTFKAEQKVFVKINNIASFLVFTIRNIIDNKVELDCINDGDGSITYRCHVGDLRHFVPKPDGRLIKYPASAVWTDEPWDSRVKNKPKCGCGAHAVDPNSHIHSDYCDLYQGD